MILDIRFEDVDVDLRVIKVIKGRRMKGEAEQKARTYKACACTHTRTPLAYTHVHTLPPPLPTYAHLHK